MAPKPKPKPKPKINIGPPPKPKADSKNKSSGPVFIGIEAGSNQEKYLKTAPHKRFSTEGALARAGIAQPQPAYKTGTLDNMLTSMNPDQIQELQLQMLEVGLLSSFQPGEWNDGTTRSAFKKLVGLANSNGISWEAQLARLYETGGKLTKGDLNRLSKMLGMEPEEPPPLRAEQPPLSIELTNRDDIKALTKGVAKELFAGNLSPEEEDLFVMLVQNAERDFQTRAHWMQYNQGYSRDPYSETPYYGPGGEIEAPPGGQALAQKAEDFVRNANPEQAFTSTLGRNVMGMLAGLGRPGGGLL